MKKIIILSLVLFITIITITNVYAASSFEMKLKPSKNEVAKNEEFVVEGIISKIEMDKGIIALGGELEYDKDSLELIKFEGAENWATPSYYDQSKKFATDRADRTTSDESVFKITFKVKDQSKDTINISLPTVSASNGKDEVKLTNIKTSVTLKKESSKPDNPNPDNPNPDQPKPDNPNPDQPKPEDPKPNTNTNTNPKPNTNTTKDPKPNTNTNNDNGNKNLIANNTLKNTNTNTEQNSNSNSNTNNASKNTNIVNNSKDNTKGGRLPKAGTTFIISIIIFIILIIAAIFYIKIRIIDNDSKH